MLWKNNLLSYLLYYRLGDHAFLSLYFKQKYKNKSYITNESKIHFFFHNTHFCLPEYNFHSINYNIDL